MYLSLIFLEKKNDSLFEMFCECEDVKRELLISLNLCYQCFECVDEYLGFFLTNFVPFFFFFVLLEEARSEENP